MKNEDLPFTVTVRADCGCSCDLHFAMKFLRSCAMTPCDAHCGGGDERFRARCRIRDECAARIKFDDEPFEMPPASSPSVAAP